MRWCLQLSCYNLEMMHKPGVTNTAADCISCLGNLDSGPELRTRSVLKDSLDIPVADMKTKTNLW